MATPELFVITEFDCIIIISKVADSDTTILIWQNYSDLFITKKTPKSFTVCKIDSKPMPESKKNADCSFRQ